MADWREDRDIEKTTEKNWVFLAHSYLKMNGLCVLVYWQTHPTVMSKMLEPTELDTAMSPRPFRATITLVIKSGIEVPAANIVKPMISSVIQKVSPT